MSVFTRLSASVSRRIQRFLDGAAALRIRCRRRPWPCRDRKILVVGCESSGTTPISHLLLRRNPGRFLIEGENPWVWGLYKSVYQGHSTVREYPRLQLYDAIKVPGFAAILPQFLAEFPDTSVIYVVRDPRDVVVSAYKTWRVNTREDLPAVSWIKQTWLGIADPDPVVRLAMRWRIYLETSYRVPGVIYVRYEDFCADKVRCVTSLAERLGLSVDKTHLKQVCDRQASTPNARNYEPEGPGAWQHSPYMSGEDAQLIWATCGEQMERWGYTVARCCEEDLHEAKHAATHSCQA